MLRLTALQFQHRMDARNGSTTSVDVAAGKAPRVSGSQASTGTAGSIAGGNAAPAQGASVSKLEETLLLQIRASKLPEPVRECRFHETRRWRADFAWPEQKLLVEVEGGHWTGGRHTRGSGFDADCEKYAEAVLDGWRVIRVTGTHIRNAQAIDWIRRALSCC